MESKTLLKELLHLSLGAVVISADKVRKQIRKLVKKHKLTGDEGEKALEQLGSKSKEIKEDFNKLITRISGKTKLAREEVEDFFEEMIEKPKEMKDKVDFMARKISINTSLKFEEARDELRDFIRDTSDIISRARSDAEKWINKGVAKSRETRKKGKEWLGELKEKSNHLEEKINPELKKVIDRTLEKLHLARTNALEDLEKRLNSLEKKELTKMD